MSNLFRSKVREVFADAADLPPEDVSAFLDRACAGDAELRREVESLLDAISQRSSFLRCPTDGRAVITGQVAGESVGSHVGPYKLLQQIGRGGFGTVFMAEQEKPVQRRVAVKIIRPGMDSGEVVARFEAERQALAMMDHSNIARVFDGGVTDAGRPYFVMELVKGEPITAYCDRNSMSVRDRLGVFVQVCNAVQHAHTKGVIHRDLKPGNVLVATEDGAPRAKVIDFGIAKAIEQRLTDRTLFTDFRRFIGTPEYMSPEQAEGSLNIDTRTDVYSLGVVLYELITGETPFDAKSLRAAEYGEIQRIIREVDPPKPSTRVSSAAMVGRISELRRTEPARLHRMIRGDLDWIVMRSLDKDRARRYGTAEALAADVERHLAGLSVEAVPPSRAYRTRKFIRRHRVFLSAAAAVGGALMLGVVGTTVGLFSAIHAEQAARRSAAAASEEAEQAKAMNEFMRQVLTSVEPQNSGADVRLTDVLANATAAATKRFGEHPLLEAQVQDLLADVYSKIGQPAKAKEAAQRTLVLYRTNAGSDDPRALRAESRVIGAALNLNQTDEAARQLDLLLPRAERILGPDDRTTLEAKRSLATVSMLRGRIDEAERLLLELHAHPKLADDDAIQTRVLYTLCRIRQRRAPSPELEQRLAEWKRTEELAMECVERAASASGAGSADMLRARGILAQSVCDQGRFGEAVDLCRVMLAESETRFDPCHINRRNAMTVLADALAGLGEFDEPATVYMRIIECARAGREPITLLSHLGDGLKYLDRSGRNKEGEALAREGLEALRSTGGGHGDIVVVFESYLAHFISASGRIGEAEPIFVRLLAGELSLPGNQLRARLNRFYAEHLTAQGRFSEAEERLGRAVAISRESPTMSRDRLPDEIACSFIALYRAANQPDKVHDHERQREQKFGISPRR